MNNRPEHHDIIDVQTEVQRMQGLKAWGWLSYVLHLVVALGAICFRSSSCSADIFRTAAFRPRF